MRKSNLILAALCALAANGCFTTTVRSGLPRGNTPLEADNRWHSGFIGGTAEASGPYDLTRICPEGWSEITTKTSVPNGVVQLVTGGIYDPQTIHVTCAANVPATHAAAPVKAVH
jgi:hypothetical protein